MPPRNAARASKRGAQTAAARAWDRAAERVKELGDKILRDSDVSLSASKLSTAVDDLSVLINRATKDGTETTPGVWAAVAKNGGAASLLALYGAALRCSCASLTPSVAGSLRPAHAAIREGLASELAFVDRDVEIHLSKHCLARLALGLLNTHVLRCYTALLSDALQPLMTQFRELSQRLAPHRRTISILMALLAESRDVMCFLRVLVEGGGIRDPGAPEPLVGEDVQDLIGSELAASGLLEAWSRGALLLAACDGQTRLAAVLIESFFCTVYALKGFFPDVGALQAASPSFAFLLSAHITQLTAALDGGAAYGLPAAVAPWSAPLLAQLLPGGGGGAAAAAGPSGGSWAARQQGRLLDFDGEASGALYLASMSLWAWSAALRDDACTNLGSPLRPGFFHTMLTMVVDTDVPPPCAAAAAAETAAAEASAAATAPPPPSSLRRACEEYLRRLSLEIALGRCADAMLASEADSSWPGLREVLRSPVLQPHVVTMTRETKAEAARLTRLAAMVDGAPLNAVAVADTCLRLTTVAWETLLDRPRPKRPHAGGGQRAGQGQQQERFRHLRLTRSAAAALALDALTCAKAACVFLTALAARVELPRRAQRLMEGCWREWIVWAMFKAGASGPDVQRQLAAWDWGEIGRLLSIEFTPSASTAPPSAPTATVAAAISAGLVSSLRWLLRRLRDTNIMQCTNFLSSLFPRLDEAVTGWQLLLGFGPKHDVARLQDDLLAMMRKAAADLPPGVAVAGRGVVGGGGGGAGPTGSSKRSRGSSGEPASLMDHIIKADEALRRDVALGLLGAAEGLLFCYSKSDGTVRLGLGGLATGPPPPVPAASKAAGMKVGDAAATEGEATRAEAGGGGEAAVAGGAGVDSGAVEGAGAGGEGDRDRAEGARADAGNAGAAQPELHAPATAGAAIATEGATAAGDGAAGPAAQAEAGGSSDGAAGVGTAGDNAIGSGWVPAGAEGGAAVAAAATRPAAGGGTLGRPFGVVLSRVAVQFLPATVELWRRLVPRMGAGLCTRYTLLVRTGPMMCWIPCLCVLATAPACAGGAAADGGEAAAAAGPAPASAVPDVAPQGSWGELLLHRVDALGLLRDVVGMIDSARDEAPNLPSAALDPLHDAVVALAAFLPHQLSAALKQPPTPPEATPADSVAAPAAAAGGGGGAAKRHRAGRKAGAPRSAASMFDSLMWLFSEDGPLLATNVGPLLRLLRDWREEEEGLDVLIKRLPPPLTAAEQQQGAASVAITLAAAARAGSVAPPPPRLRAWLDALEKCDVLETAKLASWRDGAALFPAGPPAVTEECNVAQLCPAPSAAGAPAAAAGRGSAAAPAIHGCTRGR